jgi:signal transduction histidine kinase
MHLSTRRRALSWEPKPVDKPSPTIPLLAGLAVSLSALAVYSAFTIAQFRGLKALQEATIERNRKDSLLLLRIQNSLNSVALAMRDMLDGAEGYPLTAWQSQFRRIRADLDGALRKEQEYAPGDPNIEQRNYLADSITQFWDAIDRLFALGREGKEREGRALIRLSLEARQEALSTAVARLLVLNNEAEHEAARRTEEIYARVERNVYLFVSSMLLVIVVTSLYLVQYNRRMFQRVADLSQRRSELAQQLISMQESTLRAVSRELHDDFGQVLTAIGAILKRTGKHLSAPMGISDLREAQEIVQKTVEKIRSLSRALHPVILEEIGLESALDQYLPSFEKQTGIRIQYQKDGAGRELDRNVSIHLYRVMQEALNNIAKHSKATEALVRLRFLERATVLEVEDDGIGFQGRNRFGLGLISMRERAELVNGDVEFLRGRKGALVRVTIPQEGTCIR